VDIGQNSQQYTLTIPPHIFLGWNLSNFLTQSVLDGIILTEHDEKLRRMDIAAFPVWLEESANKADEQRRIAFYRSIEARIRRFGGSSQPAAISFSQKPCAPATSSAKANTAFLRMSDYIAKNFKTDIHIEDIAETAGLNQSYAITLFRKESGITITDFITMLRVYEAQRLLLTSDMKIIDIAMEAGFGSMSNFYNCFKKICGKNPRDYRKDLTP
jgi:AraC-like DNA-binding protein